MTFVDGHNGASFVYRVVVRIVCLVGRGGQYVRSFNSKF